MAANNLYLDTQQLNQHHHHHHHRYLDVNKEPHKMLLPIEGYEKMPLISIIEAIKPLVSIVSHIDHKAWIARQNSDYSQEGFTPDQSAPIMLYSMEGQPRETSVYFILNSTLRSKSPNRSDNLKPWLLYLKLFITALTKLPSHVRTIYRGIEADLSTLYPENKTFVWWGIFIVYIINENIKIRKIFRKNWYSNSF